MELVSEEFKSKEWYEAFSKLKDDDKIWATMYGENLEKTDAEVCILQIPKKNLERWSDKAMYYIWGLPGPDFNIYYFEDYGKSWALTKEELLKYPNADDKYA